jgi:tRNA/tmRNA/rRNA uracil-C5-methylase (TrmA/RlmC/RlmD family)
LCSPLPRHGSQQADKPKKVVGVEVGEEHVVEAERNAVTHHLPLRTFATIEEKRFAFAHERDGRNVAFDSGARSGCTEETKG